MTLNTAVKNWLAQYAGLSSCFASSGIAYNDPDGMSRTGGTGDVLNAYYVAHLLGKDTVVIKAATNYTTLKSLNNNVDIILDDVSWAYNNDGSPAGEPRYCVSGAVTPTPLPTPAPTPTPTPIPGPTPAPGLAGTFEFQGRPVGNPTISLDLAALVMKQATDYHFEMNDIKITNTSPSTVYLAMEIKLYKGVLTSCPVSGYVFDGLDRTSSKNPRIKTLAPGEVAIYDTDYYQPLSLIGVHTVCLLVHGTWTTAELNSEIAPITG